MPSIKHTVSLLVPAPLISLALLSSSHAAIWWDSTSSTDAYTANDTLTFDVDPTNSDHIGREAAGFQGIEVEASASLDGSGFYAQGGAGGRIIYNNANALGPGETVSFTFNFNMQLFSGARQLGAGSTIRSAAMFRVATADVDGTLAATLGGGNDTLQNYFGTPPVTGAISHTNSGQLEYNTEAGFTNDSVFDSFSAPDTAIFTEDTTGTTTDGDTQFAIEIIDNGRGGPDYAYQSWTFSFTNDAAVALAAGTNFFFTFEGQNFDAQEAAVVPEPSSVTLLTLVGCGFIVRRRR